MLIELDTVDKRRISYKWGESKAISLHIKDGNIGYKITQAYTIFNFSSHALTFLLSILLKSFIPEYILTPGRQDKEAIKLSKYHRRQLT